MDSNNYGNGWSKYQEFVLRKLEDIDSNIQRMHDENAAAHAKMYERLAYQRNELTALKTKIAVWGMVAFAVASTVGPAVASLMTIGKP